MTERVEVTSADKIAAARIAHDGEWEVSVAEAFARHRQTAYRAGLEKAKEIGASLGVHWKTVYNHR